MTGMIPEGHYSVRQMAGFLCVSDRRVRELIARGELMATRVGERAVPDGANRAPRESRHSTQ